MPDNTAGSASHSWPRGARIGVTLLVTALLIVYLGQHWRHRPTETDDGLLLEYIHQMSRGALPFWDFVDLYGPLNWVFPVPLYVLSGEKVWAIHVWVLALKLLGVWACYWTVSALANRFYGVLAGLWLTVLLGQGWGPLQTPYASFTALPLALGAWHMLLSQPYRRAWLNPVVAGVFTTLVLWSKLNTGIYLFAGGLFVLFYFNPGALSEPAESPAPLAAWFRRLRIAGALGYAAFFTNYVREFFGVLYFVYLIVPLYLVLGYALYTSWTQRPSEESARAQLKTFGLYLGTTLGLSLVILLGYYRQGAALYMQEMAGIVATMNYHYPFPPVGKQWFFLGYNENYWPQLPWLVTLSFCVWLVVQRRLGERSFAGEWPKRRAQMPALVVLATLCTYLLYPRGDDIHIFQALLLVVPALFMAFYQLDVFFRHWRPKLAAYYRPVFGAASVLYAATLWDWPTRDELSFGPGDYENPRLEYLDYRPPTNPKIRSFAPQVKDDEWDRTVDQAARYIDSITEENERVFVFCDIRFLNFASRTAAVGGRYVYYIYLISVRLLDRAGFDKLAPPSVVQEIMTNPPRVMVTRGDQEAFVPQFPDLRAFRDRYYDATKRFGYLQIYELKPGAREEIERNPPKSEDFK
ncbi:MAG TPA: hypothetical protein VI072_20270 [Polyangiaceae bacterium]